MNNNRVGKLSYFYDINQNGFFVFELFERHNQKLKRLQTVSGDSFKEIFGESDLDFSHVQKFIKNGVDVVTLKEDGKVISNLMLFGNNFAIGKGESVEESFIELNKVVEENEEEISEQIAKVMLLAKMQDNYK